MQHRHLRIWKLLEMTKGCQMTDAVNLTSEEGVCCDRDKTYLDELPLR
jgi:hypothetical protein